MKAADKDHHNLPLRTLSFWCPDVDELASCILRIPVSDVGLNTDNNLRVTETQKLKDSRVSCRHLDPL